MLVLCTFEKEACKQNGGNKRRGEGERLPEPLFACCAVAVAVRLMT